MIEVRGKHDMVGGKSRVAACEHGDEVGRREHAALRRHVGLEGVGKLEPRQRSRRIRRGGKRCEIMTRSPEELTGGPRVETCQARALRHLAQTALRSEERLVRTEG